MREWLKLSMSEKSDRLKEAQSTVGIYIAAIADGINAVTLARHKLSDTEWLVLTDLSQTEYDYTVLC